MSIDMLGTVPIGPSIEKGTVVAELTITAPDDGSVLGTIGSDDRASIDAKVRAAENAMAGWAAASPMHRAEVLLQIAAATREALPELAAALSKEQGKTRKEALLELDRYVGPFVQYAGLATVVGGRHQQLGGGVQGHVERGPVGVVAAVVGGPEIGELLVTHPQVARVAFTGSTAVGRRIAARAGEGLKRLSLELGGCDPFVLLEDADLKGAVRALMGTRFYNAGQVCVAPKRLVVHERVADEVVALLAARIERVEPGPGLEPGSTMGPLHTEAGRARLEEQVHDAVDAGAELVGGGRPEGAHVSAGWFLRPALLLDPPVGTRVRTEETFGPVLSVVRVRDDDEAVAVANETAYGLGASVWSADRDRAWSVARRVPAGYTWINALGRVYDELPFGGVRASGMGREHGLEALESYLEDRTFIYPIQAG
jgi:acyl-CoA reductase-like NAD-dependent aldehyde dehydrogenase